MLPSPYLCIRSDSDQGITREPYLEGMHEGQHETHKRCPRLQRRLFGLLHEWIRGDMPFSTRGSDTTVDKGSCIEPRQSRPELAPNE